MKRASMKDLQELLGHMTISMPTRYAHLSQEHKKKAVNLLKGLTVPQPPANDTCHKTVTSLESGVSPTGRGDKFLKPFLCKCPAGRTLWVCLKIKGPLAIRKGDCCFDSPRFVSRCMGIEALIIGLEAGLKSSVKPM